MNFEDLQRIWAGQFKDAIGSAADRDLLRRVREGDARFKRGVLLGVLRELALLVALSALGLRLLHQGPMPPDLAARYKAWIRVAGLMAVALTVLGLRLKAARWVGTPSDVRRMPGLVLRDRDRFSNLLLWRDLREFIGGAFVIGVVVVRAHAVRPGGYAGLAWAGVALLTLPLVGILIYRLRSQTRAKEWDGSVVGMLTASIDQTRQQVWALEHIQWYLAPVYIGVLLAMPIRISLAARAFRPDQAKSAMILTLAMAAAWGLNRWVARHRLRPRLEQLEALRRDLSEEP